MQLVFFTDLDGTLLDHETYDFSPALPALAALKARGFPLILASSKTAPEIASLRSELGFDHCPAIVENGSGELPPGTTPNFDGDAYQQLREALSSLPAAIRQCYNGFGDMTDSEVVTLTGLSIEEARLAKQRGFTEPGVFDGSEEEKRHFIALLADRGISARDGGRFLTLSFGRTKADGLKEIAHRLGATQTVALGDAPNDLDMLLAADQAVIVRNDHGTQIADVPGAIRTEAAGPVGWNTAVLSLLDSTFC